MRTVDPGSRPIPDTRPKIGRNRQVLRPRDFEQPGVCFDLRKFVRMRPRRAILISADLRSVDPKVGILF